MSCDICGRGSCTKSFHSLEEQERHDDPVGYLESELNDAVIENEALQARVAELEKAISDGFTSEEYEIHLDITKPGGSCHLAADAFWKAWKENGETHKHGYYESTWISVDSAIAECGVLIKPRAK